MIRTTLATLSAGLVAATLGSGALTQPAQAGGQIAVSIAPASADADRAMRTGLALYALFNNVKSGGIKQTGTGNAAGLAQNGSGNLGIVHQEGSGHNGTLTQNGNGNAYGLFQFGQNTGGHVAQNGTGNTGATFLFGW